MAPRPRGGSRRTSVRIRVVRDREAVAHRDADRGTHACKREFENGHVDTNAPHFLDEGSEVAERKPRVLLEERDGGFERDRDVKFAHPLALHFEDTREHLGPDLRDDPAVWSEFRASSEDELIESEHIVCPRVGTELNLLREAWDSRRRRQSPPREIP